jgi:hypothetical protein
MAFTENGTEATEDRGIRSSPDLFLDVLALRFRRVGRFRDLNKLRGSIGARMKHLSEQDYSELFAPKGGDDLPSGFADPPRPFVLRLPDRASVGVHLFKQDGLDALRRVMEELGFRDLGIRQLRLSLEPTPEQAAALRIRVLFLSPTDLKRLEDPQTGIPFEILIAQARDRISALKSLYQAGTLALDFVAMADRARAVRALGSEIQLVQESRVSRNTGQTHSIGGFIGSADYEGAVGEFLPYLEAARWTGIGRQTVWGKGEISVEILA